MYSLCVLGMMLFRMTAHLYNKGIVGSLSNSISRSSVTNLHTLSPLGCDFILPEFSANVLQ